MRAVVFLLLVGCAQPVYSLRVPHRDASFHVLVAAASRTVDDVTGAVERDDLVEGGPAEVRLYTSKGVEEVEVRLRSEGEATQLTVSVDRPELYPPGIAEAFWRKFTLRLNAGLDDWSAVERGDAQAELTAPVERIQTTPPPPVDRVLPAAAPEPKRQRRRVKKRRKRGGKNR
ncbi:MAG: hypothetical protein AAFU77_10580 [Myxococcota bacterium]